MSDFLLGGLITLCATVFAVWLGAALGAVLMGRAVRSTEGVPLTLVGVVLGILVGGLAGLIVVRIVLSALGFGILI